MNTTHKDMAAQFAGAEEAKDAGNDMFRKGDHALALACYQRALELGLGAHDGVAGADEACLYSIYANLAAAWLGLGRIVAFGRMVALSLLYHRASTSHRIC